MKTLTIVGAFAALGTWAFAQEPTPSLEQLRNMSREERIKAHQRRIEQIIQENKRRQEEEARKAAEARAQQQQAGATASPTPLTPSGVGTIPQGPVQVYIPQQQPGARPGATPPPSSSTAPTAARSEARSLLFFRPFDSVVKPGDTFVTEIVADTKDATADEFLVCVEFPTQTLNLLAVDFAPVSHSLQDEVEYAYEPGNGRLGFHLKLSAPEKFPSRAIAICYWEALAPAEVSEIRFSFGEECSTDIRLAGQSILGTSSGRSDGVIHANVVIKPRSTRGVVQKIGQNGLLVASARTEVPKPSLKLQLHPSQIALEKVKEGVVEVELVNEQGAPFDKVQLYLQFDPSMLEVIDVDRGNWIRAGTNIEDGFAHESFPFDFHKANSVDNEKGIITYEEGCELTPLRSQGTLARIHFRAKAQGETFIALMRNRPGTLPNTNISYLSQPMLADYPGDSAVLDLDLVEIQILGNAAITAPAAPKR